MWLGRERLEHPAPAAAGASILRLARRVDRGMDQLRFRVVTVQPGCR